MSQKKKKTNPNRRPATHADVLRAKREAVHEAVRMTRAIIFTVLLDKYGEEPDEMAEIWRKVNVLSDEIVERRVNVADLICVLREEYGLVDL